MSDFLKTVMEAFKNLLSHGLLRVETSGYDEQAFGNAVVVLAGQNLRVRIVRDRGETIAEAASSLDPDNWFPLQRVVRAVGVPSGPLEGLLAPEEASQIIDRYFTELESGLGAKRVDQTKKTLSELERFARKRLLDRAKSTK